MKQQFNAKERSADDWKDLFEQADERFRLNRIINPPGSILAVIEFVWR
jgi:6-hydroxytryprostatin B O-methyltransferase